MNTAEPISRWILSNREVLAFRNISQLSEYAEHVWLRISESAIERKGRFTAALSGGKSPVPFYQRLAGIQRSGYWDRADIFIVDERFVPYDAAESNYRMIREAFLDHVSIPYSNVHPIPTDTSSPEEAAQKYEETLKSFFRLKKGDMPVFDIMFLGMGVDGHTASLFPGTQAVSESLRLSVAVFPPDRTKKERISLTLPVINNADHIIFEVAGAAKSEVMRDLLAKRDASLPASLVVPVNGTLLFLIDEPASRLLHHAT